MNNTTGSSALLECVRKLVRERPATLTVHALAAEMGCSRAWLSTFANGGYSGASAVIVERLYIRLTGKQLIEHNV